MSTDLILQLSQSWVLPLHYSHPKVNFGIFIRVYSRGSEAYACSAKIRLRRSAQNEAAGASGLTIGVMLHVPLI